MKSIFPAVLCLATILLAACQPETKRFRHLEPDEVPQYLHVPSPEHWEDQIIYFLLTDRFADGDSSNNDFGAGEYNPKLESHWNGGDLKGVIDHLSYIKKLGATAIWITPPVANQWVNPQGTYTGYHGYWAEHMMEVDQHYGSLADYQMLSATLHANDMYLIQDVVVNHMGDYFSWEGEYDPENVVQNYVHYGQAPRQKPFDQNNALDPKQREEGIYHWAPEIQDFADKEQKLIYSLADLDDLNTSHPEVQKTLNESFQHWIKTVGVDGYRYDTPLYVDHAFFQQHFHGPDGIIPFAEKEGKKDFFTFGETWVAANPMDDTADREAGAYMGTEEKPEMSSILNFPLHQSAKRVFAESAPTTWLRYRIEAQQKLFEQPGRLLNFIDNHDMQRMRAGASFEAVQQNLLFFLTTPGIPIIYYGTEQEFIPTRQAMFTGGFAAADNGHFNPQHRAFRFLQALISLRKDNPVFSRGKVKVVADDANGAGIFAYEVQHEEETLLVVFNTSGEARLVSGLPVDWAEGHDLEVKFRLQKGEREMWGNQDAKLNFMMLGRDALVLAKGRKFEREGFSSSDLAITAAVQQGEILVVQGNAPQNTTVELLIDGKMELANSVSTDATGGFSAEIPLGFYPSGTHQLSLLLQQNQQYYSTQKEIEVDLPTEKLLSYQDPIGDDHGPTGSYQYPSHPSFDGQMDIAGVALSASGMNVQIDIRMAVSLSTLWLPPNDFDHVNLAVYLDLPEEEGSRIMPFRFANLPEGMAWDRMISAAGWSCNYFSAAGAAADHAGSAISPGPKLTVFAEEQTIRFNLSAAALGYPKSLAGLKVYVATWDGGGETDLRPLKPKAEAFSFGGGSKTDPRIMDDTKVLVVEK
ncbi:MAG: alpha-amylase family glycosyl hydrolase [Bacteroidota bacterium]